MVVLVVVVTVIWAVVFIWDEWRFHQRQQAMGRHPSARRLDPASRWVACCGRSFAREEWHRHQRLFHMQRARGPEDAVDWGMG